MFRNILVPVDLTDKNVEAVDLAGDLAKPGGSKVLLFHVIELIPGLPAQEEKPFYERLEKQAWKQVGRLGERLERKKVKWKAEIRLGSRAREILKRAAELPSDLIVLSSHRVSVEKPGEGFGTLSYQIAILSPTKVLLVK